jgi:hypothetical protein|tara:strand:- start:375 stop:566 length:192 start_codon:yes stop_codon:yes gene_type:complete
MSGRRIHEMPIVEIRESTFELDDMLSKLSAINSEHTEIHNDITEAILCLGNEIKRIKSSISNN